MFVNRMTTKENVFLIDALKYLPIKILPAITGLLTIFILTKYFSEINFINYTFIITTLLLVNQLCAGWVNSSMMFFVPKSEDVKQENQFISNVFLIELILGLIGCLILFITVYLGVKNIGTSLIICFIFFLQISINFLNSFLQSKRLIKAQVKSTTLQALFQIFALLIVYYFFENNLFIYLVLFSFSFLISLLSLLLNKNVGFQIKLSNYNKILLLEVISYGMPICIWFFATQAYSVGDRLLLKYFNVSQDVVNYVAFRDLSTGLSGFISMPLLFASHPIIMNLVIKEKNKAEATRIIEKNINILLLTFLPCILVVFFYGQTIFSLFLGAKYILSPIQMLIILLTILIACVSVYLQKGLEVSFYTKYMMKSALAVTIFSLIFNFTFIPKYGVYASIVIGLISQMLYVTLIAKKAMTQIPVDFKKINLLIFSGMISVAILCSIFVQNNICYLLVIIISIIFLLLRLDILSFFKNKLNVNI